MERMNFGDYIASDGLMSLEKSKRWTSWSPLFPDTCDNDNGILYLTTAIALSDLLYPKNFPEYRHELVEYYLSARYNTMVGRFHGLYHRNPGRTQYVNSHDNCIAMAAASILGVHAGPGFTNSWPVINNVTPGKIDWSAIRTGHPSGLHAPHHWLLYRVADGKPAHLLGAVWLWIDSWWISRKFGARETATDAIQHWLMYRSLERVQERRGLRWWFIIRRAIARYKKAMLKTYSSGIGEIVHLYYDENHPCSQLAEIAIYQNKFW